MSDFLDLHRPTLQSAVRVLASREYWTPDPEVPSGKIYGETARAEGEAAFAALLGADLLAETAPQKPVVAACKAMFGDRTGTPVGAFGGYAHDAWLILTDAIGRAGSAEPAAIRDAIEATTGLAGTTGIYTMTPEDHLGLDLSAFRMREIKGGKWTLIE